MADFEKLADAVIKGNQDVVLELTQSAVDEGVEPNEI
ncbi:MAG: B12-binding domain-containing protein, partial [Bacillota bacterium]